MHHTNEDVWGNGDTAPSVRNLGSGWRQVVNFMPWLLYLNGDDEMLTDHSFCHCLYVFVLQSNTALLDKSYKGILKS
jgi:hypothetical protein